MIRFERLLIYGILMICLAAVGTAAGLMESPYVWSALFALIGLVFLTLVEIYIQQQPEHIIPPSPADLEGLVQIIYGEDALKKVYRSMQKDPECVSMRAVWCTRYADVQKYFKDEKRNFKKNDRLNIQRLVNPIRVNAKPDDLRNHVKNTKDLVKEGRYSIRTTEIEEVECNICEYQRKAKWERKALFVFNDLLSNSPKLGILLDPARHETLLFAVDALTSWFDRIWEKSNPIIPLEE